MPPPMIIVTPIGEAYITHQTRPNLTFLVSPPLNHCPGLSMKTQLRPLTLISMWLCLWDSDLSQTHWGRARSCDRQNPSLWRREGFAPSTSWTFITGAHTECTPFTLTPGVASLWHPDCLASYHCPCEHLFTFRVVLVVPKAAQHSAFGGLSDDSLQGAHHQGTSWRM